MSHPSPSPHSPTDHAAASQSAAAPPGASAGDAVAVRGGRSSRTHCTVALPCVSVPVLSNTITRVLWASSRGPPPAPHHATAVPQPLNSVGGGGVGQGSVLCTGSVACRKWDGQEAWRAGSVMRGRCGAEEA